MTLNKIAIRGEITNGKKSHNTCLECWVNYQSSFYFFWELAFLASLMITMQFRIIQFCFCFLALEYSNQIRTLNKCTYVFFFADMFYNMVV